MILDYNPSTVAFVLLDVPQADIGRYMSEFGLDYSTPQRVLYTHSPYAAAPFAEYATPAATAALGWIMQEVEASRAPVGQGHYDVPEDQELWDFQKADLDYMLRRDHSLDADQPGLGKTPTAIVFANEVRAKRVLVLCPASIRLQWLRKIMEWSTMGQGAYRVPDPTVYAITTSRGGVSDTAAWTVCSYDLAHRAGIYDALVKGEYDVLILDEAHYLKSTGARRSRAVFGGGHDPQFHTSLAARARRVIALTGTPLPNRPREVYPLARHLCHDAIDFYSEERFNNYFNPIEERTGTRADGSTYVWRDEQSGRHPELQMRLRAHFMTRHLKREVLTQLKMPVYDLVQIDDDDTAIRAALRAESLLEIDPETFQGDDGKLDGHVAEVRQMMGIAMAPGVARYAETCLDGGDEKLVIFFWHKAVGDYLEQKLHRYGVLRVDGTTSPTVKDARVQEFRTQPDKKVLIGNILSLGTGTDGLQDVCYHAIIGEPDWTPGNNIQCFDRLDRGGQTRTVQGDIMVVPNSFAERVLASALRKLRVTDASLDRRVA